MLYGGKNLVQLYPIAMWKAELVNDELGYLAKEIPKDSIGFFFFFFTSYSKIQEERN